MRVSRSERWLLDVGASQVANSRRMIVMVLAARIRILTVAVMFLVLAAMAPAWAQKLGPAGAPNPTASVTSERTLLQQAPRIEGRIDIPDSKAAVLIQPAGRTWDYLHGVLLHWGGP